MLIKGEIRGIQNFVFGYLDSDNNLKSFAEMLRDVDLVMTLPNVQVSSKEGIPVPFLMTTGGKDLTKIFRLFDGSSEVRPNEFLQKIVDATKFLDIDFYRKLNEIYLQAVDFIENRLSLKIDLPITKFDGTELTKTLVSQLNSKSVSNFNVKNNKTIFRDNEESELFIALPNPDALTFSNPSSFIPKMVDVFKPYRHMELNTMAYKRYLQAEGINIEFVDGSPDNITDEIFDEEKRYYDALCNLHKAMLDSKHPGLLSKCESMNMFSEHFKDYITELVVSVLTYHWNQHGMLPIGYADVNEDDGEGSDASSGNATGEMVSSRMFDPDVSSIPYGDEVIKSVINEQFHKDIYFPINILIQCLRFGKKKPTRLKLIDSKENGNIKYKYFDLSTFQYLKSSGSLGSYEVQQTPNGCNYTAIAFVEMNNRISDQKFLINNQIKSPLIKLPVGLLCEKRFKGTSEVQRVLISFVDIISNRDKSLTIEGVSVDQEGNVLFTDTFPKEVLELSNDKKASLTEVLSYISNSNDGLFIPYVNASIRDVYMEFTAFSKKLSTLDLANDFIQKHDLSKLDTFSCFNLDELKLKCQQYGLAPTNLLAMTIGTNESKLIANVNDAYINLQNDNPFCTLKDLLGEYKSFMRMLEYTGSVFFEEEVLRQEQTTSNQQQVADNQIQSTSVFGQSNPNGQQAIQPVAQQPVASTQTNPNGQTTQSVSQQATQQATQQVAQVDSFEEYLNKNIFENREFTREQIMPVVMSRDEITKVNAVYEKLKNPFRVKELGTFDGEKIVVGYLVMLPDKKYYLLDPVQKEYGLQRCFDLNKIGPTIIRLLNIVINRKPSPLKFTTREAFDYYTKIGERI